VEKAAKAGGVAGHHLLVVADALFLRKENPEHRTHMVAGEGDARLPCLVTQALDQLFGARKEGVVKALPGDQVQGGKTGGHGHRIAGQGARLIDGTEGGNLLHHLAAPAKGAHRHAAANDFAQANKVGPDAIAPHGAVRRHPEARHHLIDNQQCAVLVAAFPQGFEKSRRWRDAAHIARHRFDDDTGHLLADLTEGFTHTTAVVVGEGHGVIGQRLGHAGGAGHAQGQGAGTGFYQQGVGVAVVAAFKLDDLVAVGKTAGEADGAHGGFGAGVDHAHHVESRYPFTEAIGEACFEFGGGTKSQAPVELLADGIQHRRVAVAEHHRPPGLHVVHIALAVGIVEIGA